MRSAFLLCGGLLLAAAGGVSAANVDPASQYKAYLTQAQTVEPIAEFGEQVSLRDGKLSFRNNDITLTGTGPAIHLVRTVQLDDGRVMRTTSGSPLGEWQL